MHVSRFGEGSVNRAQEDNPPEMLQEHRVRLLAKAIRQGQQPHPKVDSELFWRAVDLIYETT